MKSLLLTLMLVAMNSHAGCIVGDCDHGWGIWEGWDGTKIAGNFKDNKVFEGKITYPDGRVYVGPFRQRAANGKGTMTYPDGSVKSGIWKRGKYVASTVAEAKEAEKKQLADAQRKKKSEAKYKKIYSACILDKGSSVNMEVSSMEQAVKATCKRIAKDPSWLESIKYD